MAPGGGHRGGCNVLFLQDGGPPLGLLDPHYAERIPDEVATANVSRFAIAFVQYAFLARYAVALSRVRSHFATHLRACCNTV